VYSYVRDGDVQVLQLPYVGDAITMAIVLPDPGRFAEVERTLDAARLERLLKPASPQLVVVALPKFRIEASYQLRPALETLGLGRAFTPEADFSGISTEPGFAIDDVIHKTFIDVDEHGTEAAAVTMPVLLGAAPRPMPERVYFTADRPFAFVIRDAPTN